MSQLRNLEDGKYVASRKNILPTFFFQNIAGSMVFDNVR